MTASAYLWELRNDTPSRNFIDFNYFVLDAYVNYGWSPYNSPLLDALMRYANLPNAGPNAANGIVTNITQAVSWNWSDYYGWNDNDLYRAPVPDWTYHWGSNQIVARYGNMNNLLADNKIAKFETEDCTIQELPLNEEKTFFKIDRYKIKEAHPI